MLGTTCILEQKACFTSLIIHPTQEPLIINKRQKILKDAFISILSRRLDLDLKETAKMLKKHPSVAYLVGYLAALNYFTDRYDSFAEAAGVTEDLNEKIDWDVYLKAIDLMKIDYIKNVDPKTWPAYRNIYLSGASFR